MDFIERWFGVSPDGGTGLAEVSYILLLGLVIVLLLRRKILWFVLRLRGRGVE